MKPECDDQPVTASSRCIQDLPLHPSPAGVSPRDSLGTHRAEPQDDTEQALQLLCIGNVK